MHYSDADVVALPPNATRLDLLEVVKKQYLSDERLQALHLHNFKLKSVYKNLCRRLLLPNLYSKCIIKDGLQALRELQKYREDTSNTQPLDDVVEYNKVDCIVLALLHAYMMNHFFVGMIPHLLG